MKTRPRILLLLSLLCAVALAQSDRYGIRVLRPVPEPGIHPRIFFTPEDVPDIRKRATETEVGRFYMDRIASFLDNSIHRAGSKPHKFYLMLQSGEETIPHLRAIPYESFDRYLMYEAYYALLLNDPQRSTNCATAIAAYARNYRYDRMKEMENTTRFLFSHDVSKHLALAYDLAHSSMTAAQRADTRRTIAAMVANREPYGWRQPRWKRGYNHVGDHQFVVWANLAIEGEEGYQPELTRKTLEVVRDYANLALHDSGFGAESVTYSRFGFESTLRCMLAFKLRGIDMFQDTNVRFYKNYMLYNLTPSDPSRVNSHGDGGWDNPLNVNPVLKYMYPDDKQVDFLYRECVGEKYEKLDRQWGYFGFKWFFNILLAQPYDADGIRDVAALGLERTVFCPDRGEMIARTGWGKDDLKFDIECREDISIIGHQHSSRGGFYLQALGRDWVIDQGYHQAESHRHSLIHIDGVGQSGWPGGPGCIVEHQAGEHIQMLVCDARYAYDWTITNQGWRTKPEQLEGWEHVHLPYRAKFGPEMTRELPLKDRRGDGVFGHFPDHIWREPFNPVQKAIRTGMLVKGKYPYVLIVDDIQKDAGTHCYEWFMQVADDLEIKKAGNRWVLLGSATDPSQKARLLVHLMGVGNQTGKDIASRDSKHNRAMTIKLEKYQADRNAYEGSRLGTRLVVSAYAQEPEFKVLLYPVVDGDPMPVVNNMTKDGKAVVSLPGQRDAYEFRKIPLDEEKDWSRGARTVFRLTRNGTRIHRLPEGITVAQQAVAATKTKADATRQLLAHWPLDALGPAAQLTDLAEGVHGQAYGFDGILANALFDKEALDLAKRAPGKISVSFWFKSMAPNPDYGTLFSNSFRLDGMIIRAVGSDAVSLSTAREWNFLKAEGVRLGVWNHLVATSDGTLARLWLNGELAQERPHNVPLKFAESTVLGLRHDDGFCGLIDDIRIHNYVLSATEIGELVGDGGRKLLATQKPVPTTPLRPPYQQPDGTGIPLATAGKSDGRISLLTKDAWLEGHKLSLSPTGAIGHWTMDGRVHWKFEVTEPGTYAICVKQSCIDKYEGSEYDLIVGDQVFRGRVQSTGHWNTFKSVKVGDLTVARPGTHVLTIRPTSAVVWVMNSMGVELTSKQETEK